MKASQLDRQDKTRDKNIHSSQDLGCQKVKPVLDDAEIHSDECLRREAWEKVRAGDNTTAIAILTHLVNRNPTNAANYNNRGLIYFQTGQMEKAIADYNTALQLNPRLDNAYNNRANYYASLGKLEAAIADYEQAIDLNFGNIRARINQGITFRQLGLYELALENFDLALILGEHLAGHIYAERGRTYHLRGDWNSAIADYRRALVELPVSDLALRLRLQVKARLNELLQVTESLDAH